MAAAARHNSTRAEFSDSTLHDQLTVAASRWPRATSLVGLSGEPELSFRELHLRASRLASVLRRTVSKEHGFIGLLMARSVEMIVGIFGILTANAAYLPISPNFPPGRVAEMVDEARCTVSLIACLANAAMLPPRSVLPTVLLITRDGGASDARFGTAAREK
jgi:non-ribosomal peptide synthetase component F